MRNVVPTPSKPKTTTTAMNNYAQQQFPTLPSYIVEPEDMRQQKRIDERAVDNEEQKIQMVMTMPAAVTGAMEPQSLQQQALLLLQQQQQKQQRRTTTTAEVLGVVDDVRKNTGSEEKQRAAERSSEQATGEDVDGHNVAAPAPRKPENMVEKEFDELKIRHHHHSTSQPRMRSSQPQQRHYKKIVIGGMPLPQQQPQLPSRSQSAPQQPPPLPSQSGASRRTSSKMSAAQQSILDESGKLLNVLRKEVSKLRNQNAQLRSDYEALKESNTRLQDANATAGIQFSLLNQHAQQLHETTIQQAEDLTKCRQQLQQMHITHMELKEELNMKQATYVAEVQSRLHHQTMLSQIMDRLQEKCRDARLVEELLTFLEQGESEYNITEEETNGGQATEPAL